MLVRRTEGEGKIAGGLIIPDSTKQEPQEGEAISRSEGARKNSGELIPTGVTAGDKFLFKKWSGAGAMVADQPKSKGQGGMM